ncbi:MAG: mechanosensitive ion channel family protein [Phormidesmis sp.]
MNIEKITELLISFQPVAFAFIGRVVLSITIFFLGRTLARIAKRIVKKIMVKAKVDPTLTVFATNILFYAIMAFVVLAVLGQMGIETTSLVAAIGAAGLAIGLALQGSLTNFAAGIIIIIFRPFHVGDWIEADGYSGYVIEIELLTTTLKTLDNRTVVIPNGTLTNGDLVNYSTQGTLRLDLVIGVDYSTDIDRVKAVFMDVLTANSRVLESPEPSVGLLEMADSSLNFAVRPWVETKDYLPLSLSLQEEIKKRLDKEGINIPFPQRDVHLVKATETAASLN